MSEKQLYSFQLYKLKSVLKNDFTVQKPSLRIIFAKF